MFKKFKAVKGLVLSAVLLGGVGLAASPAAADMAGWQPKGSDYISLELPSGTKGRTVTGTTRTYEGNMKITLDTYRAYTNADHAQLILFFYEADESNADDFITEVIINGSHPTDNKYVKLDISKYEDGDNGKAEIYVKYLYNFDGNKQMINRFHD